jgi:immune inhibitor A
MPFTRIMMAPIYLWEQLGEDAIRELSRHPANGMAAIYAILEGYLPDTSLAQFTADWAAANYLDDPDAGPIYHYQNLNLRRPSLAEKANPNDELDITQELDQFAVDYIDLNDLRGETTITFAGNTNTPIIGAPPRSGEVIWYAPAVNDMNAQLTASFDLRNVDTATLKYAVWYDLEDEYDFAYVSISSDGGETWDLLMPSHHRSGEYGPAYNDRSVTRSDAVNGWLKESISLNPYVGHVVLIRFDVLTDSGVTGQGFAIDDISIPELGYETTIDDGIDGWQAEGFVNIGWQLPQQWSVQLIEDGPTPKVTPLPLNELNQGQWIIDVGKGGGVLVIMPQTPFINEPATYWLHVEQ